jgi:hypothetical protein
MHQYDDDGKMEETKETKDGSQESYKNGGKFIHKCSFCSFAHISSIIVNQHEIARHPYMRKKRTCQNCRKVCHLVDPSC